MITDRIQEDLKTAMKARDSLKVTTLRMASADIKNARIAKKEELTDDEVVGVLKRAVKQREEAVAQYRDADRPELAEKEEAEAAILSAYLPRMLEGDALRDIVRAAIESSGATSMKEMGQVMKVVMADHASEVDGKAVQAMVRELLG